MLHLQKQALTDEDKSNTLFWQNPLYTRLPVQSELALKEPMN